MAQEMVHGELGITPVFEAGKKTGYDTVPGPLRQGLNFQWFTQLAAHLRCL